jgi:hypothetical protein
MAQMRDVLFRRHNKIIEHYQAKSVPALNRYLWDAYESRERPMDSFEMIFMRDVEAHRAVENDERRRLEREPRVKRARVRYPYIVQAN